MGGVGKGGGVGEDVGGGVGRGTRFSSKINWCFPIFDNLRRFASFRSVPYLSLLFEEITSF
jgi:hypothetical protein